MTNQLGHHISKNEFERAFIDVLGWTKLKHSSQVELPDVGRLPRGWKTKETQARIDSARRIKFNIHGVASIGPQVVLRCESDSGNYTDELQRERIARELGKLFYSPIIVFISAEQRCQDWYFPQRTSDGLSIVKFTADRKEATERLASALAELALTIHNFQELQSHLEIFRRVSLVREALNDETGLDYELKFAKKFAKFGTWAFTSARKAFRDRVRDIPEQVEIGRKAKAGDRHAIQRFFDMHQYLVLERSREYLKNKHTFISEFEDYVGAGNLGIARGLANYDPNKPYAPSTLIFYHIDKQVSRAFGLLELPMWVPVHLHGNLISACWREKTAFDQLAQEHCKVPTDSEVLRSLELEEDDLEVFGRFKLSRLWENRVCWEEIEDDDLDGSLIFREAHDQRDDLRQLEAYVRLKALLKPHRIALMLRTGAHPIAKGDPLTLEEVGKVMGVTRERARQLILKAEENARKIEIAPIDPPVVPTLIKVKPRKKKRIQRKPANEPTSEKSFNGSIESADEIVEPPEFEQDSEREQWSKVGAVSTPGLVLESGAPGRGWLATFLGSTSEPESAPVTTAEPPIQLALIEVENENKAFCDRPPKPPSNIRKANAYVEFLLDTFGPRYCPSSIYEALQNHFPQSIITESVIRDKFRRRGWRS